MFYTKNTQITILKLTEEPKPSETITDSSLKVVLPPFTEFIITEVLDHRDKHLRILAEAVPSEAVPTPLIPNQPFWIFYDHFDLSDIPPDIFGNVPDNKLSVLFPDDVGCLPFLNEYMTEYGIVERGAVWCFLATVAHETGGLQWLKELGSHKQYCGRGIIQLTGKSNYQAFELQTGIPVLSKPELLEQPEVGVHSGCWFWKVNKLNELSQKYSLAVFEKVTKVVTGGKPQWKERLAWLEKVKSVVL